MQIVIHKDEFRLHLNKEQLIFSRADVADAIIRTINNVVASEDKITVYASDQKTPISEYYLQQKGYTLNELLHIAFILGASSVTSINLHNEPRDKEM